MLRNAASCLPDISTCWLKLQLPSQIKSPENQGKWMKGMKHNLSKSAVSGRHDTQLLERSRWEMELISKYWSVCFLTEIKRKNGMFQISINWSVLSVTIKKSWKCISWHVIPVGREHNIIQLMLRETGVTFHLSNKLLQALSLWKSNFFLICSQFRLLFFFFYNFQKTC